VKPRYLWLGPLSALLLYGIFWLGREVSTFILPFASGDISRVYVSKVQLPPVAIGLLLLFVIGPAEEIYWHGFVQRVLGERFGAARGLLITTGIYTLVHLSALNAILLIAAAVCGFFWGWLYQREKSLVPVILSHAIWDLSIFMIVPLA
jgi:membrane protease YdiL (CAAX protease family)